MVIYGFNFYGQNLVKYDSKQEVVAKVKELISKRILDPGNSTTSLRIAVLT